MGVGSIPPGGHRARPARQGAAAPRWHRRSAQHRSVPRASAAQRGPPEPPAPIPAPLAVPRPAARSRTCSHSHFPPFSSSAPHPLPAVVSHPWTHFPHHDPFFIPCSKFLQCKPIFHTVPMPFPTPTPLPTAMSHAIPVTFPDPRPVPVLLSHPIPQSPPAPRPIFGAVPRPVPPGTSAGARCPSSRCSAPAAWPGRPQWKWSWTAAKVWGSPRSRRDGGSASTAAGQGVSGAGTPGTPRLPARRSPVWPLLARVRRGLSGRS